MLSEIFNNPLVFSIFRIFVHNSFKGRLKFLKHLNLTGKERVIDICCGTGYFSQHLPKNYTGVDNNKYFINYAKNKYKKNFILHDATNLRQFKDKSFDIAFVIDCLHHFPDELAEKIISEGCRLAKKLVIIDMIQQSNLNIIGKALEKLDRGKYVRTADAEKLLASKFADIKESSIFSSGVYREIAFVCEPKP